MRLRLLLAAVPVPLVAAFSLNAYDLGFYGIYPRQRFHSVDLEAPSPKVTRWDSRCDHGNLLLTPRGPSVTGKARGPIILDARGDLVWQGADKFEQAMNLNVQNYKGSDYLTFWTKDKKNRQGKHSKKSYVLLDSSYEVAYRIYPHGHGLKGDSHEFRITPQGTALITIYDKHEADCTQLGLGKSCWIQDGLFQEINIETGDLIFEWRAIDHISMKDVFSSPSIKDGHGKSKDDAFDYFHINSVDKNEDGDFLISARYMHAVVCISGTTGEILWQLGGKNNVFHDLNGATKFAWQHHVTWQGNNTLSLFDNNANNVFHSPSRHSKGMLIQLNMEKMTASLLHSYVHPDRILAVSQGSVQVIPGSGNVLVGFGNSPSYVEYSREGAVLCDAHFAPHLIFEIIDFGIVKSYRIFKSRWAGKPKTVPDVKVKPGRVYVSWNGATEVTSWRLEFVQSTKGEADKISTVQELERYGFETSFALGKIQGNVRVAALDAANGVMAYSAVVKTPSTSFVSKWAILFFFIFCIAALIYSWRRSSSLPRLQRLPSLIAHWRKCVRRKTQEYDSESDPLLLNSRDP